MTIQSNLITTSTDDIPTMEKAGQILYENRIGKLPIVTKDGKLCGLISRNNIYGIIISPNGNDTFLSIITEYCIVGLLFDL